MSKSKDIGTRAETAVRNYLLSVGYSEHEAHRNILSGSQDKGDVWLRDKIYGLIVFEVKGGKTAKEASFEQVQKWYKEAELERKNASANLGFLVCQRPGIGYPNAGKWWAYATLGNLIKLSCGVSSNDQTLVRVNLSDLIKLIHG
nr:MAG TPA_asm: HOLLIDAY JUNCTION RESOLVASE HOMOLOGOUS RECOMBINATION [Caudoviricetes sp.]